jgi:hypothetical protein
MFGALLLIVSVLVLIGVLPALSRRGKEGHRFGTVLNGPDGRSLRRTHESSSTN